MNNMLVQKTSITAMGALITLALFAFMARLIYQPPMAPPTTVTTPTIEITQTIVELPPKTNRELPKPPEMISPPRVTTPVAGTPNGTIETPTITELPQPPVIDNGPGGTSDYEVMPVVQIEPQYPIDAAQNGIEGYVIVRFDVQANGAVTNVQVADANPRRIFDKSALAAVKKWKYKPRLEAGKAVAAPNQQVRLDFTLDKKN
ncbi:energy transducer TonB [Shewanella sedimentimangrovi]|uniref:Energy transducer TonB n=1 Tax=Shewanella sedimentimangrovi TaxID=2814293 RepID=A0ABX7R088_9GAMM|nr:energy transducer TonB [Shewanella sedimentimangrovi]QSX37119.1 energy transducer TonB [Shewanella sedimentimangrovi]